MQRNRREFRRARAFTLRIVVALVMGSGLGVRSAKADATQDLCHVLEGHGAQGGYRVLDTRELTRVDARPWMIVPHGVAILLEAPSDVTAAGLHRKAAACAQHSRGAVAKAQGIEVRRHGGHYVVKLTAKARDAAQALARSFE